MSHKLNFISTRIDDTLHEKVKQHLDANGASMSDFLRMAVEQTLSVENTASTQAMTSPSAANTPVNTEAIAALTAQLQIKDEQLQRKDTQLEQLQCELSAARQGNEEAAKRSDILMAQLTTQLDRVQYQLEDLRHPPSFWQRLWNRGPSHYTRIPRNETTESAN